MRTRIIGMLMFAVSASACGAGHPPSNRVSTEIQTVRVRYVQDTCDPFYPRLFPVVSGKVAEAPLLVALPPGLQSPEDSDYAVDGNEFELTGYAYEPRSGEWGVRFDLVGWQVRAPYEKWRADAVGEKDAFQTAGPSFNARSVTDDPFRMRKYNPC